MAGNEGNLPKENFPKILASFKDDSLSDEIKNGMLCVQHPLM